jgi:hypothetical protein
LSILSAKKAAGTMVCLCGTLSGFTTSYSQRESIRDFGAVRPPPSFLINSRAHAAQSQFLRLPLSTLLAGPHDALF